MKQYLEVNHTAKLKSEATPADDIEGTLYKFVPADYTKSEEAFEEVVEKDATAFKPMGTRLGAYKPARGKGKGKAKAKAANGADEVTDEDEVAFEFYHVCPTRGRRADVDYMVHAGLQRVPSADAAVHPAFHRGGELHPTELSDLAQLLK